MKKTVYIFVLLLISASISITSCKKDDDDPYKDAVLPTVTTVEVTDIAYQTAKSGGNITDDGGGEILARGVVYGGAALPTIEESNKTTDGTGSGSYVSEMTGLAPGVTYYVRAYVTNNVGTAYGQELSFTTLVK